MTEVTLLSAFVAGTLALLSPCSALLVPSFFAYAFTSRGALAMRTGVFYVGLATVLVPLGVGAGAVSSLVYDHRSTTITVAGSVIIALGVWQLLGRGFVLPFANRLQQASGCSRRAAAPAPTPASDRRSSSARSTRWPASVRARSSAPS